MTAASAFQEHRITFTRSLLACQRIGFVKQFGGHIKLYSEVQQGTSVKIYLPRFVGTLASADLEVTVIAPRGRVIVRQGRLDPGVEVLTKPFTSAQLASQVRAVLDALPGAKPSSDNGPS